MDDSVDDQQRFEDREVLINFLLSGLGKKAAYNAVDNYIRERYERGLEPIEKSKYWRFQAHPPWFVMGLVERVKFWKVRDQYRATAHWFSPLGEWAVNWCRYHGIPMWTDIIFAFECLKGGTMARTDPGTHIVGVDCSKRAPGTTLISGFLGSFCHEMVHVEQNIRGWVSGFNWKGQSYAVPKTREEYLALPWEVDARQRGALLASRMMKDVPPGAEELMNSPDFEAKLIRASYKKDHI